MMEESEIITAKGYELNQSWLNFINWVQTSLPEGEFTLEVAAGSPIRVVGQPKPKIRFDKKTAPSSPISF